jgi:hypothetical protein
MKGLTGSGNGQLTHKIMIVCKLRHIHRGVKVKIKITLEQATKAQRGSVCIALLYL